MTHTDHYVAVPGDGSGRTRAGRATDVAHPDVGPRMLDLRAHELLTGDLFEEGRQVFSLDNWRGTVVMVTLATCRIDPDDGDLYWENFEDKPLGMDAHLRVVRDAPCPDGSRMYRYDVHKVCHGVPGGEQPCLCGEVHRDG